MTVDITCPIRCRCTITVLLEYRDNIHISYLNSSSYWHIFIHATMSASEKVLTVEHKMEESSANTNCSLRQH